MSAGMLLELETGVPFDTSYRIACAIACLFFMYKLQPHFPGEHWPRISLWIASFLNLAIFFSPLVERPASRGELILFALPDTIIALMAAILARRVTDDHQRAIRQQLILSLVVAIVLCVGMDWLAISVPPVPW